MCPSAAPAAWREEFLTAASDRFERRLAEEMSALRLDVRQTLHDELTAVRRELSDTRVEMIRWSFFFWVGQLAATAGLLAFMLRAR